MTEYRLKNGNPKAKRELGSHFAFRHKEAGAS